jgi:hypothetical protein
MGATAASTRRLISGRASGWQRVLGSSQTSRQVLNTHRFGQIGIYPRLDGLDHIVALSLHCLEHEIEPAA